MGLKCSPGFDSSFNCDLSISVTKKFVIFFFVNFQVLSHIFSVHSMIKRWCLLLIIYSIVTPDAMVCLSNGHFGYRRATKCMLFLLCFCSKFEYIKQIMFVGVFLGLFIHMSAQLFTVIFKNGPEKHINLLPVH